MSSLTPEMAREYVELSEMLKILTEEERKKIPDEEIEFYERHKDPSYHFKLDLYTPLSEQKISRGAYACFLNLYRDYIATPEERMQIDKQLEVNEIKANRKAIKNRHSVRKYKDIPIPERVKNKLDNLIESCNEDSGLHIQLITDDPACFDSLLAHYGKFSNVKNYIAVVGPKSLPDLEELGGYYGQKVVIAAQREGLNTCWVAGTYRRGKCKAEKEKGEKILCVIAIGYGENDGVKHKSKPLEKLCDVAEKDMPVWFKNGVKAAMMAPTAMNQQNFHITLDGEDAVITAGFGPMTKIDLGIVKYNFEAASGYKFK